MNKKHPREAPHGPDEWRTFMTWLLREWDGTGDHSLNMKKDYVRGTGLLVWALANHAAELARAVVATTSPPSSAKVVVALPQIRLMIECAVTAAWALVEPGAAGAILQEGHRQRRTTVEGVIELGVDGFDASSAEAAKREMDQFSEYQLPEGRNLERRFDKVKGGKAHYLTYRHASALSHAGMGLADSYLISVPKSSAAPMGIALSPDGDSHSEEAWLGIATSMLVLALNAANRVDSSSRLSDVVERACQLLDMPVDLAS